MIWISGNDAVIAIWSGSNIKLCSSSNWAGISYGRGGAIQVIWISGHNTGIAELNLPEIKRGSGLALIVLTPRDSHRAVFSMLRIAIGTTHTIASRTALSAVASNAIGAASCTCIAACPAGNSIGRSARAIVAI